MRTKVGKNLVLPTNQNAQTAGVWTAILISQWEILTGDSTVDNLRQNCNQISLKIQLKLIETSNWLIDIHLPNCDEFKMTSF